MSYRNIVVDGTPYRWSVGRAHIAVRDPKGQTHVLRRNQGEAITPFDMANRIRVEIERRPRAARPAPPVRPSHIPTAPERVCGTAYCLIEQVHDDDAGRDIPVLREVHLDAALAKRRSVALGFEVWPMLLHDAAH